MEFDNVILVLDSINNIFFDYHMKELNLHLIYFIDFFISQLMLKILNFFKDKPSNFFGFFV